MLRRLIPPLSLPVVLALSLLYAPALFAQSRHFPVPPGLEGAIEFWKQIFTRYSFAEVVLFDPLDPGTIYGVVRDKGGGFNPYDHSGKPKRR